MKHFYKISAIVALTALIFGAAFSIAGVCIGGTVEAAGNLVEVYGIHGLHFHFPFFWFGSDQEVEVDRGKESMPIEESDTPELETIPEVEKVEKGHKEHEKHTSGAHEIELYYSEDIQELDWDISCASVTVLPGEEFTIWGDNLNQNEFESYVEDGVWYLEYYQDNTWGWDWKEGLEIPDWSNAEICITIPAGTVLEEASVDLGTGEATLEGMSIRQADLCIGTGDVALHNMELQEEGYIEIGMGTLTLQNFFGRDIDIDCGMGTVKGSARLEGEIDLECGVGDVDLKLAGKETDYNYEVSCGMGSVKIGQHHSYNGVSDTTLQNNARNSISMDCGMGSIKLKYEE